MLGSLQSSPSDGIKSDTVESSMASARFRKINKSDRTVGRGFSLIPRTTPFSFMAFVPEDRRAVSREGESALLGKYYIRLPFAEGVSMMRVIVFLIMCSPWCSISRCLTIDYVRLFLMASSKMYFMFEYCILFKIFASEKFA